MSEIFENDIANIFFLFMLSLLAPVFLLTFIPFSAHPEALEETIKAMLVLFFVLRFGSVWHKLALAVVVGFLFGISESFFYLLNILEAGKDPFFAERILFVLPLHILTAVMITAPALRKKWLIGIGVVVAIVLHVAFNQSISNSTLF